MKPPTLLASFSLGCIVGTLTTPDEGEALLFAIAGVVLAAIGAILAWGGRRA